LFKERNQLSRFETIILPHLAAAYNLARWLSGNDQDAEDLVQEATLRAFKFFAGFKGEDARTWFLTIVRNTCYTQLAHRPRQEQTTMFDEDIHGDSSEELNPEVLILRNADAKRLKAALEELPPEYREVIVLRELEELTYKEIAELIGIPIGTVMSRLARSRKRLQQKLSISVNQTRKGATDDLP
jgi:RNA polymerase sigma factor (sigma-70 family)